MAVPEEDIVGWVEQLADRDHAIASAEALVLRGVLSARAARERKQIDSEHGLDLREEHALQRLRFRLRQEGLLNRSPRRWTFWLPAAAAAMLLAAVSVNLYSPRSRGVEYAANLEEPPRYRGSVEQVPVLTDQPLETARQLAHIMEKLGAQPRLYVWQGNAILDFEATPETLAALQRNPLTFRLPADALRAGMNRLVFHVH